MNVNRNSFLFFRRWLEFWQRKQRQYICRSQTWSDDIFSHSIRSLVQNRIECSPEAQRPDEAELREVTCSNKNNEILIEVCVRQL